MNSLSFAHAENTGLKPVPRISKSDYVLACLVALITFLVFSPVLRHGFVDVWDDDIAITNNPDYNPPTLHKLLHYWVPPPHEEFYVPVTYTLWGLVAMIATAPATGGTIHFNALPFHAINLGAHTLGAALVFLILRQLVPNRWAAFIGTMLFALHPIQTEAVAWASSMYTPLCGMLSLAAIWQFLQYSNKIENGEKRSAYGHYAPATLFFLLALLTKPAAASAPLIVAAIEIGWRHRRPMALALPLGFWVLLAIPILLATKLGNPAAMVSSVEPWQKLLVALEAMTFYAYKIIWPAKLCPDYSRSPNWLLGHPIVWLTCLVPLGIFVLEWFLRRRLPWLIAATAAFVAALLPTLGLTTFAFQSFSTVADRYAYIALLPIALAVATILTRAPLRALAPVALVMIFGFSTLSLIQERHWQNSWTLFAYTIQANPDSRIVGGNAPFMLTAQIESHCTLSADELSQLADGLLQQKRSSLAAEMFHLAMSKGQVPQWADDHLAVALLQSEKLDEAQEVCRHAIERNPQDAAAHATLGNIYIRSDAARAAVEFRTAIAIDPNNADAKRALAALRPN